MEVFQVIVYILWSFCIFSLFGSVVGRNLVFLYNFFCQSLYFSFSTHKQCIFSHSTQQRCYVSLKPYSLVGFKPESSCSWGGCDAHCATPPWQSYNALLWRDSISRPIAPVSSYHAGKDALFPPNSMSSISFCALHTLAIAMSNCM
jgi:hypothetical protein